MLSLVQNSYGWKRKVTATQAHNPAKVSFPSHLHLHTSCSWTITLTSWDLYVPEQCFIISDKHISTNKSSTQIRRVQPHQSVRFAAFGGAAPRVAFMYQVKSSRSQLSWYHHFWPTYHHAAAGCKSDPKCVRCDCGIGRLNGKVAFLRWREEKSCAQMHQWRSLEGNSPARDLQAFMESTGISWSCSALKTLRTQWWERLTFLSGGWFCSSFNDCDYQFTLFNVLWFTGSLGGYWSHAETQGCIYQITQCVHSSGIHAWFGVAWWFRNEWGAFRKYFCFYFCVSHSWGD